MFDKLNEDEFHYLCRYLSIFDLLSLSLINKHTRYRLIKNTQVKQKIRTGLYRVIYKIVDGVVNTTDPVVFLRSNFWMKDKYVNFEIGGKLMYPIEAVEGERVNLRSVNGGILFDAPDTFEVCLSPSLFKCRKSTITTIKGNHLENAFNFLKIIMWFCGGENFSSLPYIILTSNDIFWLKENGSNITRRISFEDASNIISQRGFEQIGTKIFLSLQLKKKGKDFVLKVLQVSVDRTEKERKVTDFFTSRGMKPFLIN